jgi:hypothetical protein
MDQQNPISGNNDAALHGGHELFSIFGSAFEISGLEVS